MKKVLLTVLAALSAASAVAAPLNINTASEKELAGLEKIGPVRAKKIVEYRNQNGQFKTKADLKKFISDKEYDAIKEKVVASGATAKAAASKADVKAAAPVAKTTPKVEAKTFAPKAAEKLPVKPAAAKVESKPQAPAKADNKTTAPAPKTAKAEAVKAVKPADIKPTAPAKAPQAK